MFLKFTRVYGLECHYNFNFNKKIFNFFNIKNSRSKINNNLSNIDLALPGSIISFNLNFLKKITVIGFYLKNYLFYISFFIRKSYFYADVAKNYQISQLKSNINIGVIIIYNNLTIKPYYKFINIIKIHLEEDAGKITYNLINNYSIVNFNRSNNFLLEIISYYNLNNFYEIFLYLNNLKNKFYFLRKRKNLKNFLRFDINISLNFLFCNFSKTKIEVKNINSLYILKSVIEFELKRQIFNLMHLKNYKCETRFFNIINNTTYFIRNKSPNEYRCVFEFDKDSNNISNYYIVLNKFNIVTFFYYKIYIKYNFLIFFKNNFYLTEKFFFIFKFKKKKLFKITKYVLNNISFIKLSLFSLLFLIKLILNYVVNINIFKKILFINIFLKKNILLYIILIKFKLYWNFKFYYFLNYMLINNIKLTHNLLSNKNLFNFFLGILKKNKFYKKKYLNIMFWKIK